ncbi:MAG TPA: DUF2167 domain-containing protein [Opitutaceae bacterium]
MRYPRLVLIAALLPAFLGAADPVPKDPAAEAARLEKLAGSLNPRGGDIVLGDGFARLAANENFRYLDPKDAGTVLTDLWRNPRTDTLGLIVPRNFDPLRPGGWVAVISYATDGYVKDDDAAKINYDKLLKQMKDEAKELSKQRVAQGYSAVELVGWAEPPRYDAKEHKLYWAKEMHFVGQRGDTLNYNIRALGRRGVLVLNIVSGMRELPQVESAAPQILKIVNFQSGSRYADFVPGTDKMATYGIAALVAGTIAAKAGLFKILLAGIIALKKILIVAAIAVAGFFKKLLGRRKGRPDVPPGLIPPSG